MEQLFSQLRHEDEARTGGDKEEDEAAQRPVFYLQSQNGNLSSTGEYASLLNDVGSEGPSWAREAFGKHRHLSPAFFVFLVVSHVFINQPCLFSPSRGIKDNRPTLPTSGSEAIGARRRSIRTPMRTSTSSCVARKTFSCGPPQKRIVCTVHCLSLPSLSVSFCLSLSMTSTRGLRLITLGSFFSQTEQKYPHASWSYDPAATAATTTTRDDKDGFKLVPTEPRVSIPWIPIDPLVDSTSRHPRYALARAMHVRLEQGDMLYLPACWYHHVSQSGGYFHQNVEDKKTRGAENEGRRAGTGTKATIAVNWWFDMKFDGHFYSSLELNRRLVKALDRAQSRRRQREMRDGTSDRLEPSRMFLREEEAGHRDEDETSLDSDDSTR